MKELNLVANDTAQQRIKDYLEHNASEILADKINNGAKIEKDGLTLTSKKTLDGFMQYATEEARKTVESGARSACIEDSVVYGWAIHYFEEDSIEETLYNEDGSEYSKPTPKPKKEKPQKPKADEVKQESLTPPDTESAKPTPTKKSKPKSPDNQLSLFDLMEL